MNSRMKSMEAHTRRCDRDRLRPRRRRLGHRGGRAGGDGADVDWRIRWTTSWKKSASMVTVLFLLSLKTAAGCWAKSSGCGRHWSFTPISRIGGRLILHQSNGKAIQRNSLGISPAVRWQKRKSEMELFIGIMIGI